MSQRQLVWQRLANPNSAHGQAKQDTRNCSNQTPGSVTAPPTPWSRRLRRRPRSRPLLHSRAHDADTNAGTNSIPNTLTHPVSDTAAKHRTTVVSVSVGASDDDFGRPVHGLGYGSPPQQRTGELYPRGPALR